MSYRAKMAAAKAEAGAEPPKLHKVRGETFYPALANFLNRDAKLPLDKNESDMWKRLAVALQDSASECVAKIGRPFTTKIYRVESDTSSRGVLEFDPVYGRFSNHSASWMAMDASCTALTHDGAIAPIFPQPTPLFMCDSLDGSKNEQHAKSDVEADIVVGVFAPCFLAEEAKRTNAVQIFNPVVDFAAVGILHRLLKIVLSRWPWLLTVPQYCFIHQDVLVGTKSFEYLCVKLDVSQEAWQQELYLRVDSLKFSQADLIKTLDQRIRLKKQNAFAVDLEFRSAVQEQYGLAAAAKELLSESCFPSADSKQPLGSIVLAHKKDADVNKLKRAVASIWKHESRPVKTRWMTYYRCCLRERVLSDYFMRLSIINSKKNWKRPQGKVYRTGTETPEWACVTRMVADLFSPIDYLTASRLSNDASYSDGRTRFVDTIARKAAFVQSESFSDGLAKTWNEVRDVNGGPAITDAKLREMQKHTLGALALQRGLGEDRSFVEAGVVEELETCAKLPGREEKIQHIESLDERRKKAKSTLAALSYHALDVWTKHWKARGGMDVVLRQWEGAATAVNFCKPETVECERKIGRSKSAQESRRNGLKSLLGLSEVMMRGDFLAAIDNAREALDCEPDGIEVQHEHGFVSAVRDNLENAYRSSGYTKLRQTGLDLRLSRHTIAYPAATASGSVEVYHSGLADALANHVAACNGNAKKRHLLCVAPLFCPSAGVVAPVTTSTSSSSSAAAASSAKAKPKSSAKASAAAKPTPYSGDIVARVPLRAAPDPQEDGGAAAGPRPAGMQQAGSRQKFSYFLIQHVLLKPHAYSGALLRNSSPRDPRRFDMDPGIFASCDEGGDDRSKVSKFVISPRLDGVYDTSQATLFSASWNDSGTSLDLLLGPKLVAGLIMDDPSTEAEVGETTTSAPGTATLSAGSSVGCSHGVGEVSAGSSSGSSSSSSSSSALAANRDAASGPCNSNLEEQDSFAIAGAGGMSSSFADRSSTLQISNSAQAPPDAARMSYREKMEAKKRTREEAGVQEMHRAVETRRRVQANADGTLVVRHVREDFALAGIAPQQVTSTSLIDGAGVGAAGVPGARDSATTTRAGGNVNVLVLTSALASGAANKKTGAEAESGTTLQTKKAPRAATVGDGGGSSSRVFSSTTTSTTASALSGTSASANQSGDTNAKKTAVYRPQTEEEARQSHQDRLEDADWWKNLGTELKCCFSGFEIIPCGRGNLQARIASINWKTGEKYESVFRGIAETAFAADRHLSRERFLTGALDDVRRIRRKTDGRRYLMFWVLRAKFFLAGLYDWGTVKIVQKDNRAMWNCYVDEIYERFGVTDEEKKADVFRLTNEGRLLEGLKFKQCPTLKHYK